jgi:hypothetical protein
VVLLEAEVPLARGALQVERDHPNLLCQRRSLRAEELLALVQPP